MQIAASEIIQQLKESTFLSKDFKVTKVSLKKEDNTGVTEIFDYLKDAVEDQQIVEAVITVNKDVTIRIQTNIINLPYLYPTQLEKVIEQDKDYELNVYAIFEAEKINNSHLRIDKLGTVDQLLENQVVISHEFTEWVTTQFEHLDENK